MSRPVAATVPHRGSRAALAAAIASLPERDRVVLALRLLEGLSTLEAAAALRFTVIEVERRLAAALARLAGVCVERRASRRAA